MRSDRFGHVVPRAGLALGAIGIVGAVLGLIQPILLVSIWYIAVAVKLCRQAAPPKQGDALDEAAHHT